MSVLRRPLIKQRPADEVRSNGQRQHLDPSPGHARAKFGGSSLPAGRARATKATAGLYSN